MTMVAGNDPESQGAAEAIRVRVVAGPDEAVVGKIGYLFDFAAHEYKSYIVTVTETEVRRLHLQDGYQYQVEEI